MARLQGGCGSSAKATFSAPIARQTALAGRSSAADTISMASTVYVGVALTSHNTAARATATFTNVTARTPTTGRISRRPSRSPSPATGATFTAPATINVTATASDTDGTITKVDFYRGTQLDRIGHHELVHRDRDRPGRRHVSVDGRRDRQRWRHEHLSAGQRDGQLDDQSGAHGVAHQSGGRLDLHRPGEHHARRDGQRRGRHRRARRFLSRLDADRRRIRAAHTQL